MAGEGGHDGGGDGQAETGGQLEPCQGTADQVFLGGGRHQGRRAAGIDDLAESAEHRHADDGGNGPAAAKVDAAQEAQVRDAEHDPLDGQGTAAREATVPVSLSTRDGHIQLVN